MTTTYQRAQEILLVEPLPDDARKRIDALFKESTEIEKTFFPMIYEGLLLRENENDELIV